MEIRGVTRPLRMVLGGNTTAHDDDGTLRSTRATQHECARLVFGDR